MSEWIEGSQVFVVDDDNGARESVSALVEAMGVECLSFASGEEFLEYLAETPVKAGCAVVDVRLRGISGVAVLQHVLDKHPALPVVLITAYADVKMVIDAMSLGALTVLPKPYRDQELWDTVVRALGEAKRRYEEHSKADAVRREMDRLSDSEREVLGLLVRGVPNKQIAMRCDISPRTVDMRRTSILRKFAVESVPELIWKVAQAKVWNDEDSLVLDPLRA